MKLIILTVTLFCFFSPAHAKISGSGSSSDTGNGEISQKEFDIRTSLFENFVEYCLDTKLCRTTADENNLLKKISDSMEVELKSPLQFDSEHARPGIFKIDGLERKAPTRAIHGVRPFQDESPTT